MRGVDVIFFSRDWQTNFKSEWMINLGFVVSYNVHS